jgi:hypothetical protein
VLPSGHSGKNCRSKGVSRVLVDASASGSTVELLQQLGKPVRLRKAA